MKPLIIFTTYLFVWLLDTLAIICIWRLIEGEGLYYVLIFIATLVILAIIETLKEMRK